MKLLNENAIKLSYHILFKFPSNHVYEVNYESYILFFTVLTVGLNNYSIEDSNTDFAMVGQIMVSEV